MAKLRTFQRRAQLRGIADERSRARTTAAAQGGAFAGALSQLGGAIQTAGTQMKQTEDTERDLDYRLENERLRLEQRQRNRERDAQAIRSGVAAARSANDLRILAAQEGMDINDIRDAVELQKQERRAALEREYGDDIDDQILRDSDAQYDRQAITLDNEFRRAAVERAAADADAVASAAVEDVLDMNVAPTTQGFATMRAAALEAAAIRQGFDPDEDLTEGQLASVVTTAGGIQVENARRNAQRIHRERGAAAADAYLEAFTSENPELANDIESARAKLKPFVDAARINLYADTLGENFQEQVREGQIRTRDEIEKLVAGNNVPEGMRDRVIGALIQRQAYAINDVKVAATRESQALEQQAIQDLSTIKQNSGALPPQQEVLGAWFQDYARSVQTNELIPQAQKDTMVQIADRARAQLSGVRQYDVKGKPLLEWSQNAYQTDVSTKVIRHLQNNDPQAAHDTLVRFGPAVTEDFRSRMDGLIKNTQSGAFLEQVRERANSVAGAVNKKLVSKKGLISEKSRIASIYTDLVLQDMAAFQQSQGRAPTNEEAGEIMDRIAFPYALDNAITDAEGKTVSETASPLEVALLRRSGVAPDNVSIAGTQEQAILSEFGFGEAEGAEIVFATEDLQGAAGQQYVRIPEASVTRDMLKRAGRTDAQIEQAMRAKEGISELTPWESKLDPTAWLYNFIFESKGTGKSELSAVQQSTLALSDEIFEVYEGTHYNFSLDGRSLVTEPEYTTLVGGLVPTNKGAE